jgi:hypothetical protein
MIRIPVLGRERLAYDHPLVGMELLAHSPLVGMELLAHSPVGSRALVKNLEKLEGEVQLDRKQPCIGC